MYSHSYRRSSTAGESSDVSTASLDTSSDVTDYSYTTDPEWAADAVVFTPTGIEVSFEKLNDICAADALPDRIAIVLQSTSSQTSQHSHGTIEQAGKDSIVSTHFTPTSTRRVSKLNGSRSGLWNKQQKSQHPEKPHPLSKFTRKESIIDLDIRLQQEREQEFSLQRELVTKATVSTPTAPTPPATPAPSAVNGAQLRSPMSNGIVDIATEASSLSSRTKPDQQDGPSRESDAKVSEKVPSPPSSPWYASESPIERDIRVTREREEALRYVRKHSCPSLPIAKTFNN